MLSRRHSSGFTLIEIMLVLVIMGLVAGYVVVNAFGNDPQDKLKNEALRFHAVATLASENLQNTIKGAANSSAPAGPPARPLPEASPEPSGAPKPAPDISIFRKDY